MDIQNELKALMYELRLIQLCGGKVIVDASSKAPERYRTFVDNSIVKVMGRFKVMSYPPDEEAMTEGYRQIIDQIDKNDPNKSEQDLVAILTLRGLKTTGKALEKKFKQLEQFFDKFDQL